MVNKDVIEKAIKESILIFSTHISNEEIRDKVSRMSYDEKLDLLNDKTNTWEKEDYKSLYNNLEFWEEVESDEINEKGSANPYTTKELNKIKEELFNYEKRIIRGYDLDKNKDKVPSYDLEKFHKEKERENTSDDIFELEQSQLDYQEKHMIVDYEPILEDDEINSLREYFTNESTWINSELSPKRYKGGLWLEMPQEMRDEHHKINKKNISNISKAIGKAPGLEVATVLYHGVQDSHLVDIHTRIGDTIKLDSYISTSYDENIGRSYGQVIDSSTDKNKLYVRFLAPKDTKGICANDKNIKLTHWKGEHEYLLDKNQKGTVVDIDYDNCVVTVLLE